MAGMTDWRQWSEKLQPVKNSESRLSWKVCWKIISMGILGYSGQQVMKIFSIRGNFMVR